jgi:hypothetical protein
MARFSFLIAELFLAAWGAVSPAQSPTESPYYARANSFGILAAYSWNSSHILLGDAENRMLVNIGVSYSRRLFLNHILNLRYSEELLPVALESDPLTRFVMQQTSPTTGTYSGMLPNAPVTCSQGPVSFFYTVNSVIYSATETFSCSGRQWTMGVAMSPVGFQWNFLPLHRSQPFFDGHGGFMHSAQAIPTGGAGSFNFTFDFGAGIELYRSKSRSIRAEYRFHHISNANTARVNPGIDSGLLQATYSFGFGRQ